MGPPDLGIADETDRLELNLLKQRLAGMRASASLVAFPSLATVVYLLHQFSDKVSLSILFAWIAIQLLPIIAFLVVDRKFDLETADFAQLQRHMKLAMLLNYFGSFLWMLVFPFLATRADDAEAVMLAVVGIAIYSSGLLTFRAVPKAAMFHIVGMTLSLLIAAYIFAGTSAFPTMALVFCFGIAMAGHTRSNERHFVAAELSEMERRDADATVRMLLNDYEEQSPDWLWTAGPRGNLREVSARFAERLGAEAGTLEGTPLIDLFRPGEERDRLARHLVERSSFRDLLLKLRIQGELRYWQLSARPREDGCMSGVLRDVTADRLIEERVAFMAHYDNLTGLANRYLFNERLRSALTKEREHSRNIALFYLDLDDFKAVNDTRGHLVGDRLLREVGTRLEQEVRDQDLVARLGGDEFAVLIETRAGAGMLIERAHRFLSVVREPYEIDGQLYSVSSSIGIAKCAHGDCDAEELLRRADLALFAAKRKGRDTLTVFEPSLDKAARDRREIETDLREAIARGELHLHYQPVVDLEKGEVAGYETLLRWYHPRRGVMTPTDFLEVAEETGLIVPIGEWVIRQALSEISRWEGDFRIAINLSPTQVKSPHLVTVVAQAIRSNGVDPRRVEFEITEHVLLQESAVSHTNLLKLHELGALIALDDFGTGYSSLSYLQRFPFDRIKIDKHFVEGIEQTLDNQAIVSSITRLADALGMATTAEGIETRAQLDLLRKLGCQEAQGFLICRPAPAENFATEEALQAAMSNMDSGIVDYRKAREAALKRQGKVA